MSMHTFTHTWLTHKVWINALTKCILVVALQFLMAGHLACYCLEGDTSIYTLTLKEQFGKAKNLLAVRKLKMFELSLSLAIHSFAFCLFNLLGCCWTRWSSRVPWRTGNVFNYFIINMIHLAPFFVCVKSWHHSYVLITCLIC